MHLYTNHDEIDTVGHHTLTHGTVLLPGRNRCALYVDRGLGVILELLQHEVHGKRQKARGRWRRKADETNDDETGATEDE